MIVFSKEASSPLRTFSSTNVESALSCKPSSSSEGAHKDLQVTQAKHCHSLSLFWIQVFVKPFFLEKHFGEMLSQFPQWRQTMLPLLFADQHLSHCACHHATFHDLDSLSSFDRHQFLQQSKLTHQRELSLQ